MSMSRESQKVLFVCTGNTCRSPMAEGLFRKLTEGQDIEVSSAGVAAQAGSSASRETLEILSEEGVDLGGFRSRMVDDQILSEADAVFCMTNGHLEMLEMMHPQHEEKYHLVCDFVEIGGRVGIDVPDPIGMGRPAYQKVSQTLQAAMGGILGYLEEKKK